MARRREGKRALGASRHHYVETPLGDLCRDCGRPRPRVDQEEEPCKLDPGAAVEAALRIRRERALPSLVVLWAFSYVKRETGNVFDPNTVRALQLACRQPFVGLNAELFKEQLQRANRDAHLIYQGQSPDVDTRVRALVACMFAVRLVDLDLLDEPHNNGVLVSLKTLEEADSHPEDWNYTPDTLRGPADGMLKAAQVMGYYGGQPVLSAPAVH